MNASELTGLSEARWIDLLDLIETGKVIPIVGRRMSLVDNGTGSPVPFQKAVAERLAQELGIDPLPPDWGLTELYVNAADKYAFNADAFHPKLKRVIGSMQPHLEPLRKIAEITDFRLFVSTAIDGFLEKAVREVRAARGETVTSHTFAPGYENPRQPLLSPGEVCVYNLLGSRETCPNWAVTVEGIVEFVLALQSEKYRPDRLIDALKERHLLAIGCQISDWLGRFFLRSLRGGPISTQSTANILIESEQDADIAFAHYLSLWGRKSFVVPGDAFAFVDELHQRWTARARPSPVAIPRDDPAAVPPASTGKVFISYCHDDRASAQELYEFLRLRRIDVWMDDRDEAIVKGADWDRVIARQVADCACFVPLISQNTESVSEAYFWKEWNLALQRTLKIDSTTRRFIFPVLCEAGLPVPEQFAAMQWTVLTDKADLESLAGSLRSEQQSLRKSRGRE